MLNSIRVSVFLWALFGLPRMIYLYFVDTELLSGNGSQSQIHPTQDAVISVNHVDVHHQIRRERSVWITMLEKGKSMTKRNPQRVALHAWYYVCMFIAVVLISICKSNLVDSQGKLKN